MQSKRVFTDEVFTREVLQVVSLQMRSSQATADMLNLDVPVLLKAGCHDVRFNRLKVDVCNLSLIAIKNLGNLLKSRSTSLNVEYSDEDKFEENPALIGISM